MAEPPQQCTWCEREVPSSTMWCRLCFPSPEEIATAAGDRPPTPETESGASIDKLLVEAARAGDYDRAKEAVKLGAGERSLRKAFRLSLTGPKRNNDIRLLLESFVSNQVEDYFSRTNMLVRINLALLAAVREGNFRDAAGAVFDGASEDVVLLAQEMAAEDPYKNVQIGQMLTAQIEGKTQWAPF